tara:strand:+ start:2932 stop:3291 length:360 start_codon:yes stop_codon:yes gene_type:complete
MIIGEEIVNEFIPMLQHTVRFILDGKITRQGRLLLISQKGAYLSFILTDKNNKPKVYEVPYPYMYKFDSKRNIMSLDYRINTLCNNNPTALHLVSLVIPVKKNRFYDSTISIECVDNTV